MAGLRPLHDRRPECRLCVVTVSRRGNRYARPRPNAGLARALLWTSCRACHPRKVRGLAASLVEMAANFVDEAGEIVGLVGSKSDSHANAQRALVCQLLKLSSQVWRPLPVVVRWMPLTCFEAPFGDFGRAKAMDFDQRGRQRLDPRHWSSRELRGRLVTPERDNNRSLRCRGDPGQHIIAPRLSRCRTATSTDPACSNRASSISSLSKSGSCSASASFAARVVLPLAGRPDTIMNGLAGISLSAPMSSQAYSIVKRSETASPQ